MLKLDKTYNYRYKNWYGDIVIYSHISHKTILKTKNKKQKNKKKSRILNISSTGFNAELWIAITVICITNLYRNFAWVHDVYFYRNFFFLIFLDKILLPQLASSTISLEVVFGLTDVLKVRLFVFSPRNTSNIIVQRQFKSYKTETEKWSCFSFTIKTSNLNDNKHSQLRKLMLMKVSTIVPHSIKDPENSIFILIR